MKHFTYLLLFLLPSLLTAQKVDLSIFNDIQPRNIGPAGMSGRITSIAVEEKDVDNIYLGSAAGGIWKSKNAGHTWSPIFDHELAASIGDIAIFQKNPDILYVGTGEGNPRNSQNSGWGMYKSLDGGHSWEHLGLEKTRQIHRVIVHPDNPEIVTIGVSGATWGPSEHRGIYRTTDGGENWEKVLYINEHTGCSDLVVDPSNPNRMLAGMWEHHRWPWYFKSGGKGTGLYLTNDGGKTWEKVNKGLPKGELGRIGLSFAPSQPNIVYAYVESASNAVYRSTDGGLSWKKRSRPGDSRIGGRPFYYADIYVDVKNENRIYSIASTVTVSEDGGSTWSTFAPGNKIHTDHHAWWAHPNDPDFLMIGHDGGLNLTHDRGKNWWFADNLPLAQFYHIRVDNEVPYNVMGGLQDNGSWVGPSQVRFKGGIRNLYWQRVSVGDGFDVVPDPLDPDYGYSMGQAGTLYRYHRPSGQLNVVKPSHPNGEYLRFNWNAGIGINPFDQKTIYYGSQYVHKSSDHGASWEIISPDLSTNDTSKQHFLSSGGLTYDATGAENHTTIISIVPSALQEGLIWVGTDDGRIHVTTNEGTNWSEVGTNIQGVPANNWVTHILASKHDPKEAFVVFDDHRRDNWDAYVFRTKDMGKNWERIVGNDDVRGFVYTIEQDPVEPNLLFCGTEFGLYISFDAGKNWNKWTQGYPTVPTTDLVIHPRDHDLVIGTFGRSIWILDDIRPLRTMAAKGINAALEEDIILFPTADAYLLNIGESIGYRYGKIGDALYNGENRPYGALIHFYLKEQPKGQVKILIKDNDGKTIRTIYSNAQKGMNRLVWPLNRDAVRGYNQSKPDDSYRPRGGKKIAPGQFTIDISVGDHQADGALTVLKDPLIDISEAEMQAKSDMIDQLYKETNRVTQVMDQIRDLEKDLDFLQSKAKLKDQHQKLVSQFEDKLVEFKERISGKKVQGIFRDPMTIGAKLGSASFQIQDPLVPVTPNQKNLLNQARLAISGLEKDFASFLSTELGKMQQLVQDSGLKLFGDE